MPEVCYRLRRRVWLWAIIGPVASGFPAAIIAGICLIIVSEDVWRIMRSGSFDISWYMIWPLGVVVSLILSLPAIVIIAIFSFFVFSRVRNRLAPSRSGIFSGYEKCAWICLALSPVLYVILAVYLLFERAGRFLSVHEVDLTQTELFLRMLRNDLPGLAQSVLLLLLTTLFAAAIARPLFFRVVTERVGDG